MEDTHLKKCHNDSNKTSWALIKFLNILPGDNCNQRDVETSAENDS